MNHVKNTKSIDLIRNCMCNLCKLLLYFTTCGSFCIGTGICQSIAAVDEKNTYGDTSESETMQRSYGSCKPRCAGVFLFYIGYLCTSQLVEFIRHLPGQAGALSHLCQGGCSSIDNLLALSKGTSYRWLEARMSAMDGQIASVLLPQITGSIPRMFLRIGEWGAGFVVFFNGSAPAVFGRENRSALSGTCALRKETKNRGICLSQSAGAAFIFYSGHFDDRIASAQKSVCGADGNPDRDRRCISGSWKRHNFNSMGSLFVDSERLCGSCRAFDVVCGHNGCP